MYCILVYDVNEKRVGKMLKLIRQYLNWIQNSVFEGHLTDSQIQEMHYRIEGLINEDEDSVIIFTMQSDKFLKKTMIGVDKSDLTSNII